MPQILEAFDPLLSPRSAALTPQQVRQSITERGPETQPNIPWRSLMLLLDHGDGELVLTRVADPGNFDSSRFT
jgi:hypothetical protein